MGRRILGRFGDSSLLVAFALAGCGNEGDLGSGADGGPDGSHSATGGLGGAGGANGAGGFLSGTGGGVSGSGGSGAGGRSTGTGGTSNGTGGMDNGSGGNATGGMSSGTGGSNGTGGTSNGTGGSAGTGGNNGTGGIPNNPGLSSAADVARALGREPNFLIGMGNDGPGSSGWSNAPIHTLPVTLDLHYAYLVYGWRDWNPDGWYPIIIADADEAHGVTPMATLYSMAGQGENNLAVLQNAGYMNAYWSEAKILFQRYGEDFDKPAVVHVEPDFFAFAQHASGGDPSSLPAILAPECSDLPGDFTGYGKCIVRLARTYAPKVVLGFHASGWGGSGQAVGTFLKESGGDQTDIVVIDILDRDAGCFEAGNDPNCTRNPDGMYMNDAAYAAHLAWAKAVSTAMDGKPILWWQLPFGVPSNTPGGTPGHYRDNKVRYLFDHVDEFVEAGGVGAAFGVGAGNQTFITTDGGQFEDAVVNYYQNPYPLP